MPMRPFWLAFVACLLLLSVDCSRAMCQPPPLATANIRREIALNPASAPQLRTSLAALLGKRMAQDPSNPERFEIQTGNEFVLLELRVREGRMILAGSPRATLQVAKLVSSLAPQAGVEPTAVLPLNANARAALERSKLLEPPRTPQGTGRFVLPNFVDKRATARLTAAQQQPAGLGGNTPVNQQTMADEEFEQVPSQANAFQAGEQPPPRAPSGVPLQPFDGVQVEMLPDIDAIILRGREQQLEDLAEIIRRLDDAAQLAQPEIEVIPLQHAQAESLAELIESTRQTLFGSRQGRATLIPLVKPNALLLIGWGEAAGVAKELVAKLDLPVPPGTQFDVIQLHHALANNVQLQLQNFFQNRGGMGPVIQSTIDARTNAIIVHAAPRDLQEVRALIERLDVPRGGAMQQARVFEIRNSLAADVAGLLQQALTPGVGSPGALELRDQNGNQLASSGILGASRITVNDRNNTIIVAAAPENMSLIERLIEQLDTPGMVAKIKIFPIYNGSAAAMVETLRALLPSQPAGAAPAPQLSSAPSESSLVPLRFTVDARGNNIIAIGSEGDLRIVEALIVRLDESDSMQRKSTVYQLKNSPAVDVALAINDFLRNKRQVESATPGVANPFEQLEKEVVVVPEPVQNKLILSATPRYYEEIARLIEQLDQQPPQVMIQVMIAEISLGNTDEFGIEMGLQNSVLFDRSLLGDLLTRTNTTNISTPAGVVTETVQEIVAASNVPGFNFNSTGPLGNSGSAQSLGSSGRLGRQGLSNFGVGRANEARGFGGLVLSASSDNVSFLLRALQESRRLEILSRPQVLTLDNQQAFIQVGQRVPRIVNSIINQNGAQNNVELENVGLIIGVTPRISPEGNVVMEIDAEKSQLGPESEGIPVSIAADGTVIRSPRVDTITAQATVSAADGETIILGGLISRRTQTIHRKVPWLGDLPILKHLFSYKLFDMDRTELLIIMTPHVMRTQGDMERLKQAEFARMSWCEADIFTLHGDVYPAANLTTELMDRGDWHVIYPDIDPRGASTPAVSEAPQFMFPPTRNHAPAIDIVPGPSPEPALVPSNSSRQSFPLQQQTAMQASTPLDNSFSGFPTVPEPAVFSDNLGGSGINSMVVPAAASSNVISLPGPARFGGTQP
jgi:general secretion pathway protein D